MKYIFILVLFCCICLLGRQYSVRYQKQMQLCENFLGFLSFAASHVSFSAFTVARIVQEYNALNPGALAFFNDCDEPVAQSITTALSKEKLLPQKQKQLIESFFAAFGNADEQGSLQLIAHYKELFGAAYEQTRKECTAKIKLIHRLSVLAAAAVSVILI